MNGTVHCCFVTNHRMHAPCGVEIEVKGESVYVLQVVDEKTQLSLTDAGSELY